MYGETCAAPEIIMNVYLGMNVWGDAIVSRRNTTKALQKVSDPLEEIQRVRNFNCLVIFCSTPNTKNSRMEKPVILKRNITYASTLTIFFFVILLPQR